MYSMRTNCKKTSTCIKQEGNHFGIDWKVIIAPSRMIQAMLHWDIHLWIHHVTDRLKLNGFNHKSMGLTDTAWPASKWKFWIESIPELISECWVIVLIVLNGTTHQGMQCHIRAPCEEEEEEEEEGEAEERHWEVCICTTLRGVYHTFCQSAFCILQICTKWSKGTDCTTSACTSVPVPVLFANLHSACLSAPSGQRGLYHAVWIKRMYLYQAVPKILCWAA